MATKTQLENLDEIAREAWAGNYMNRSTLFITGSFVFAQPFIWIDHPFSTLGTPLFATLTVLMCASLLTGVALWVLDGK